MMLAGDENGNRLHSVPDLSPVAFKQWMRLTQVSALLTGADHSRITLPP